jgi:hypothetical protein
VRSYCSDMTTAGRAPIDCFAAVISKAQGGQCMDNSYADFLAQVQSTVVDKSNGGLGLRSWTWQCCTQFSYWQTCEDDSCPLSRELTLDSNTQQCQDAFGSSISKALNVRTTAFSNSYLGGQAIASSRIVFANGECCGRALQGRESSLTQHQSCSLLPSCLPASHPLSSSTRRCGPLALSVCLQQHSGWTSAQRVHGWHW